MSEVLLINPNTSQAITALMQRGVAAELRLRPDQVKAVTARFGAPYISSETSAAVAAHALLDAWAAWHIGNQSSASPADVGAILIGCFGDPGLFALRENASVPVIGLAEASFKEAAVFGRFAIVTGGAAWRPMLQRLAMQLGFADRLAGVHTLAATGAELAADPVAAVRLLAGACREAAAEFGVDAVILGGGGLAGMASQIQGDVPVKLVDSVAAGARLAALLCGLPGARAVAGFDVAWDRVSAEMIALGKR